jgi:hypothetical protein
MFGELAPKEREVRALMPGMSMPAPSQSEV